MKIATWNVERLKHSNKLPEIVQICEEVRADILVLTETDERIHPNYKYCFQTPKLTKVSSLVSYKPSENRVSILTNYRCIGQHSTYDPYTALCVELESGAGPLLVYGTIIGIYGNRHPSFQEDLLKQLDDIDRLASLGKPICICGDLNCTFSDNYYFTTLGRDALRKAFDGHGITLLTEGKRECIDHIAISGCIVDNEKISIREWNEDKTLSDHKGISVEI